MPPNGSLSGSSQSENELKKLIPKKGSENVQQKLYQFMLLQTQVSRLREYVKHRLKFVRSKEASEELSKIETTLTRILGDATEPVVSSRS